MVMGRRLMLVVRQRGDQRPARADHHQRFTATQQDNLLASALSEFLKQTLRIPSGETSYKATAAPGRRRTRQRPLGHAGQCSASLGARLWVTSLTQRDSKPQMHL